MTSKESTPVIYYAGPYILTIVAIISLIAFLGDIIITWGNDKIILVMHSDNIFLIPLVASIAGMAFTAEVIWKDREHK